MLLHAAGIQPRDGGKNAVSGCGPSRAGLWGFAAGASAQNGLQRFESDIKPQLEVKKFTYGSASALGSAGFVLNDVVAVIPGNPATGDQDSTVKIDKVTVDELDFDRLKKGASDDELPRFAKLKIEGMTGDDTLSTALTPYGVPKVPVDLTLDYRLDTATKVLTLEQARSEPARRSARRAGAGAGRHQRQVEPDAGQQQG